MEPGTAQTGPSPPRAQVRRHLPQVPGSAGPRWHAGSLRVIRKVSNAHGEGGGKGWANSKELAPETEGWLEGPEENPQKVEMQMR